jgi:ubiquinone/menaquinone biosynthesis C-methylase UbiE
MTGTTAPSQIPWKVGDFHVIGAEHTIVGEYLCDDCDLGAGNTVLDVACGSGNTALAAARRRNRVTGLDLVEGLIERAKGRAAAEGFEIEFVTGTAEQLPFPDASFDYVLSTFGVMFAPDQQRAADEILRVCKPGGRIALANWTLESLPGAMFRLGAQYMQTPPPGPHPPIEWGTVPGIQRLFGNRVNHIRLYDRSTRSRFPSIDHWFATFRDYFGPVNTLYYSLDEAKREAFQREMCEAALRYNRAADGTLSLAMSYVNVVMEKGRPD